MTTDLLRVLRVTEQAVLGGEQTDILHLLGGLDPSRYAQSMCSAPHGPFVDEVRRLGIQHLPLRIRSKFDSAAIARLCRLIRAGRYDIVHLHGARAGLLGRVAARLAAARRSCGLCTSTSLTCSRGPGAGSRPSTCGSNRPWPAGFATGRSALR